MIPGKKYKPEDFLAIFWRRRWVIFLPLAIAAILTALWSQTLPDKYRSDTFVMVLAPQVPENFVRPMETETLQERLTSMEQQILSRTRLERIVTELDLYKEERKSLLMDEVIAQMRTDIRVDVAKARRRDDPGSFTIGFQYGEPKTAMLVTERLAELFVRENLEGRNQQADVTNQFLNRQLEEALRKLQDHEARVDAFSQQHAGRLPSQVQTNLQVMSSTRQELQNLTDGINRDRDRQIVIERTIADEIALGSIAIPNSDKGGEGTTQTAAQQLASAKAALAVLQLKLTPEHPDMRAARRRIAELEQKASAEAVQQPVSDGLPVGPLSPAEATRQRRLSGLRSEFESLERNIALKRAQAERLQTVVSDYKVRIDAAPGLESQLTQLMRDYETLQGSYTDLLKKAQAAKVASNLEGDQVSQRFKILDAARVPERPTSPNRLRLNLTGAFAGLALGLLLAGLLEYRDTSLRTEEDVLVALSLPVVALVPTMWTPDELKKVRRRRLWLLGSSAVATLALSAMALAWKMRLLQNWIR